jgi:hypothetical protein
MEFTFALQFCALLLLPADRKITFSEAALGAVALQQQMPDAEENGYFSC